MSLAVPTYDLNERLITPWYGGREGGRDSKAHNSRADTRHAHDMLFSSTCTRILLHAPCTQTPTARPWPAASPDRGALVLRLLAPRASAAGGAPPFSILRGAHARLAPLHWQQGVFSLPPTTRCIEWPRHRNQGRRSAHTVRSHAQAHHPTKAPTGYQRPRHTACSAQLCLPIIPRRGQTQAGTHASAHGMLYTQRSRVPQCSAACLALQHETRQSIINMDSVGCGQCSGGYTTNGRK